METIPAMPGTMPGTQLFFQMLGLGTQPTKVGGKLRRAVRSSRFVGILGSRHIECAYYLDFCRLCRDAFLPA
jgi:hypothetical protein